MNDMQMNPNKRDRANDQNVWAGFKPRVPVEAHPDDRSFDSRKTYGLDHQIGDLATMAMFKQENLEQAQAKNPEGNHDYKQQSRDNAVNELADVAFELEASKKDAVISLIPAQGEAPGIEQIQSEKVPVDAGAHAH